MKLHYSLILVASAIAGCATKKLPEPSAPEFRCDMTIAKQALAGYPRRAAEKKIEGWVVVTYELDGSAKAKSVRVSESEPIDVFDSSAVRSIADSVFKVGVVQKRCRQVFQFNYQRSSGRIETPVHR